MTRLANNKYVVGFLIFTSIVISVLGIFLYFNDDMPAQNTLAAHTGQVENVETVMRNDKPTEFTFRLVGSDKKFIYQSFFPDVNAVLSVMATNPRVTVWTEPNTSTNTSSIWGIDVTGSGTLVSYEQMVETRRKNARYGLLLGGMMGLVSLGLMVHFLRMA